MDPPHPHTTPSLLLGADVHHLLQINANVQRNWLHVSSDGSRLAIICKCRDISMHTDVISVRPKPQENFLAAHVSQYATNGVFGFLPHHTFLWECMEKFDEHYNSHMWGNQGPDLKMRMLRLWCKLEDFQVATELRCANLSFLYPQRLYPFSYPGWRCYYEVWDRDPRFNDSYALHLRNYMNHERREGCGYRQLIPGTESLLPALSQDLQGQGSRPNGLGD